MHDIHGKKVALLVYNYFEQAEFEEPKNALEAAGATVEVISPNEGSLQAMEADVTKTATVTRDIALDEARPDTYDAIVLPGGTVNADNLRMNTQAKTFVKTMLESGKPVAAICHAPWLLVSADVVSGRSLTSFPSLQDDIRNAGGTWIDKQVVIDDNLITSRTPDDVPAFCDAILDALTSKSEQPATTT